MFRTLRQRLIWIQIIPLLLAIPLMGFLLIYSLEGQIIIPQLARYLVNNARLLAEISSAEYELWGDPILFQNLISRVQFDRDVKVMFLDGKGTLLYSSDQFDTNLINTMPALPGIANALSGKEIAFTNYSILNLSNVVVDVYEPVNNASREVIGIIRLTYQLRSLYDIFDQLRWQILLVLAIGLVLSIILGTLLAISISRQVGEVTDAIYSLATGLRHEPIQERGPAELRSQAQAVNYLVDRLHNLETSRRQLLANVVHELGRPLGALRSAIHAFQVGAAGDPALAADLTHGMDDETFRLQYLLDELANLYDKTTGSLELERKPTETLPWLRSLLIPWQAAANEKGLTWQDELPEALPALTIDQVRLAQVVGNIASNAIKYTPTGGEVTIRAGLEDHSLWIQIRDTGAGIRLDEQEKIFQPFYRGDTGKRIKQGMGLGLTIARELATAHGGEISLESSSGKGSTFTLTLPISP